MFNYIIEYKEIISALIESGGVILAAIIATFGAKKIVKDSASARFRSYSDQSFEVQNLLEQAQHDVFLAFIVGDAFFTKYHSYIKKLLKQGIQINCLILTQPALESALAYIHGEPTPSEATVKEAEEKHKIASKTIKELKKKYNNLFICKEFSNIMTASYICTDFFPISTKPYPSSSMIQTMIYQYNTKTRTMPIAVLSPKNDGKVYETTVECIKSMWKDANSVYS